VPTRRVVTLLLIFSLPVAVFAQGNTFDKVRYNGGSVSTKVKPDDWDNKLTIASEQIVFALKDGQTITINPKQVTSLSYGQEAHRRVGTAIAIGVFSLGLGALSALHKTKLHYIGINYEEQDGKKQGLLIQGDKGNFRAIIVALQGVTGLPISVGDKDRNEIPAGISMQTAKNVDESKESKPAPAKEAPVNAAADPPANNVTVAEAEAMIALVSTPVGADINVDNAFVGSAPATLKLKPGKHTVKVTMPGYKDWSREMVVLSGSQVNLTATLEKSE